MRFLLLTHWLWLFGALALGIVVGWLTYLRAATRWTDRPVHVAIGAVAIGAVVAITEVMPGRWGYWLECGVILAVLYTIGCVIGWALRDLADFTPAAARPVATASAVTTGTYLFRDAFAGMGAGAAYLRATSGDGAVARERMPAAGGAFTRTPAAGGYTFPKTLPFADATASRRVEPATGLRRHWSWPTPVGAASAVSATPAFTGSKGGYVFPDVAETAHAAGARNATTRAGQFKHWSWRGAGGASAAAAGPAHGDDAATRGSAKAEVVLGAPAGLERASAQATPSGARPEPSTAAPAETEVTNATADSTTGTIGQTEASALGELPVAPTRDARPSHARVPAPPDAQNVGAPGRSVAAGATTEGDSPTSRTAAAEAATSTTDGGPSAAPSAATTGRTATERAAATSRQTGTESAADAAPGASAFGESAVPDGTALPRRGPSASPSAASADASRSAGKVVAATTGDPATRAKTPESGAASGNAAAGAGSEAAAEHAAAAGPAPAAAAAARAASGGNVAVSLAGSQNASGGSTGPNLGSTGPTLPGGGASRATDAPAQGSGGPSVAAAAAGEADATPASAPASAVRRQGEPPGAATVRDATGGEVTSSAGGGQPGRDDAGAAGSGAPAAGGRQGRTRTPGQPATVTAMPGEKEHAGARPEGLMTPRDDRADDLKRIRGIGPQNEGRLHGLGIWHFDQIAAWTPENVRWVGSYLAFPGRIDREKWVEQAQALASGGDTEFSKRVRAGKVASSADDGSQGQSNVDTKATPRPRKPRR